ncbi:MAG TPA: DUF2723 domain-containing protein [Blastocatellia bacterium]|nr:DUF2723 domain-containing protein [Blastocatellia bacterium]
MTNLDSEPTREFGRRLPRVFGIWLLVFVLVFVVSLAVYLKTLAPTVTLVDSGELIVASRLLGVAHPPGFPLYVVLAHLFSLLPIGNVAVRVNFASAFFAALASAIAGLIVAQGMMTSIPAPVESRARRRKGKKRAAIVSAPGQGIADLPTATRAIPAIVAGLALAWSRTLWAYATITEVYTLNTLMIVLVLLLMMVWRRNIYATRSQGSSARDKLGSAPAISIFRRDRALLAAAFIFGLGLGDHHVTIGLTLPALGAFVLATEGWGFFKSLRLLYAAIISFAGLAIYIYLPLAAARSPVLNWGDPVTAGRIWDHITGKQYRVFLKFAGDEIGKLLGEFFTIAGREFGPPWAPLIYGLAILGFIALWRKRDRAMFALLSLIVLADLAYGLSYEIAEDKDAYYLPVFIAVALAAGFGAGWLVELVYRYRDSFSIAAIKAAPAALSMLIVAVPLFTEFVGNYSYNNKSHFYIARDYIDNILGTVQQGGMLMTEDWQVYSPLMYVREVEKQRTDVIALDALLLRRVWYYDYLRKEYPDMVASCEPQMDDFLEDLRASDRDLVLYDTDPVLNHRINTRFTQMLLAFVKYSVARGGAYLTEDVAVNPAGDIPDFTKSIGAQYQLVPQGLVFQLEPDQAFHVPETPRLLVRGLFDNTIAFDPDDVVEQKVKPTYLNMLVNRGRYLKGHDMIEPAAEAYDEALRLQPDFPLARKELAELRVGVKK